MFLMFITFASKFNIKMLSILIPTYNYNVFPLAALLRQQCAECNIAFEIIVLDDGSASALNAENEKINELERCSFSSLKANIGRSAIRNLLAKEAKYDWLLFLDADTTPVNDALISKYLPYMNSEEKVVYGGIKYQKKKPEAEEILRWVYGNEREALPLSKRAPNPHLRLLTLNFLIKKSVFEKVQFNETIPNLRHEDTLFSYDLKIANIKVEHIENEVYHLGLESSAIFMRKSEESLVGLKYLLGHNLLASDYVEIADSYTKLKKWGIRPLVALAHKIIGRPLKSTLLGPNPSLFVFDLYRLGYLCSLK